MKKQLITALLVIAAAYLFISAAPADISGDWELTLRTPRREMAQKITFLQEGEKLTVTVESRMGEAQGEGKITEDAVEWKITRSTPRGEFTITYKGTLEGDSMSGSAQIGDRFAAEWTAQRVSK